MTLTAPRLIWLNGAFGSGKSSVARRLVRACPGAWLLDPERIGFRLRRTERDGDDFRTLPQWRAQTLAAALAAARDWPERLPIVPMALAARFDV